MYKEKTLHIISSPRQCGKTYRTRKLKESLRAPIVTSKNPDFYKGCNTIIIDDLPEEELLIILSDPLHPINLCSEVYYFRTFTRDPKGYFIPYINRTWRVILEVNSVEEL